MGFAICYDIENACQVEELASQNIEIYSASICYGKGGIGHGRETLSASARRHGVCVAMANYTGPCYKYDCAGSSGFWNSDGSSVLCAPQDEECLLLAEFNSGSWENAKVTSTAVCS